MAELIDLDAVVPEDLEVQIAGQIYRLPGDAPTEMVLRLSVLAERLESAGADGKNMEEMLEMREELSAEIEALFRLRQPELEEGSLELSDRQVGTLIAKLFGYYYGRVDPEADDEGGDRPTESGASSPPKPRSSGRSRPRSRPKARKASASSTSSQT